MLHLQYYNSVLKKNHITKIINNYKLKYSRVVNEIQSKINEMMKLCLKDILSFLENIEEVSDQKHKLSDYDKNKRELEIIKQKLKSKSYIENKLKNDLDLLQQENNLLKLKITSLNKKISNFKNININNSLNNVNSEKNSSNRNKSMPKIGNSFMSPKIRKQNNLNIAVNNISIIEENINNKSTLSLQSPKKNLYKSDKSVLKPKINNINQKKKINANKFLNNNKIKSNKNINRNINNNNNSINKLRKSYDRKIVNSSPNSRPIINKLNINNNIYINKNTNKNKNSKRQNSSDLELNNIHKYSPLNSFSQSIDLSNTNRNININYNDLGKNINEALDNELKELEQDEANIELLLEQLGDENED